MRRFIELDILRGLAISIMIIFHILWDLDFYGLYPLNHTIYNTNQIFASIFFILVGVCLTLSSERKPKEQIVLRGLYILLLAMIISILSFYAFPDRPIYFGALHLIGVSITLSPIFLKLKLYNILFFPPIILIGIYFLHFVPSYIILGVPNLKTLDYFPLFPWLGLVLLGIVLGNILYKDGKRQFHFPHIPRIAPIRLTTWLGRHSLKIYLAHQPIIVGSILLIKLL